MTATPTETGGAAGRRLPVWAGFGLAVGLVWLGGQFVRQGVSDNFLADRPDLAVLWQGNSSDALAALARNGLKGRDPQGAARLAAKALQRWPLNEPALSTYALAMEQVGQTKVGDSALALANGRGWRDVQVQMWLFRSDVLAGRYASGFAHADALMRRQDAPPPIALQILTVAARDPRAIGPLAERLAANPSWRERLIGYMSQAARPPATDIAGALLTRLAATPAPPTDAELAVFLDALVQQGRFQEAEADWRRLSPLGAKDAATVKNGTFERTPGTTAFDWSLQGGVGWTPTIAQAPGDGRGDALKIDYDGVSKGQPVQQLLVLAPGAYRLSGRLFDEGGVGAQTLAWTVRCISGETPLASAPPPAGPSGGWRPFEVDFTVPPGACPAQFLRLATSPGDVREDVAVWYDDLAIAPAAAPAPKP